MHKIKFTLFLILSLYTSLVFAQNNKLEKLEIVLDWYQNPDQMQLLLAKEHGDFAANGLDVTLSVPTDTSTTAKLVASGKNKVAILSGTLFFEYVNDNSLDNVRFATLIGHPVLSYIYRVDSDIKSPADLKGKRVGVYSFDTNLIELKAILKSANLTINDVNLVTASDSLNKYLISGQADVIVGYRNVEFYELQNAGLKVAYFKPEEYGLPNYDETMLITNSETMKNDKQLLVKVASAIDNATNWIINNEGQAWQLYAKAFPEQDNENTKQSFYSTVEYLSKKPSSFSIDEYKKYQEYLLSNGYIKNNKDIIGYVFDVIK